MYTCIGRLRNMVCPLHMRTSMEQHVHATIIDCWNYCHASSISVRSMSICRFIYDTYQHNFQQ